MPIASAADQDALGVEAVQDVAEALAFFADAVLIGDEQAVDEDRVRVDRLAAHLRDAVHVDLAAVEVGVEDRDAVGRPRRSLRAWSCASAA